MEEEVDGILVVAHELKAPLTVLRQLAFSLDKMDLKNEHIRFEMVNVSERAIKQVNDLTKIRRLEEGIFTMEPVAIREVCDAVSYELRCLFNCNERDLRVKYTNKSRLVTANRDLLYSVIYNFLLNAMHYSDNKTRIELKVSDFQNKVKVIIRDYGPSISMDLWRKIKQEKIEKPIPVAMRPGSSGLGLYIASKFSKYMNAKVGAVRHKDGVSFYVELPISKQASLF